MRDKQPTPDVKTLEDSYKIVGELRGSEGVRKYMATRRADGTEVVITLYSSPGGGANNELSHFAADVQLLSSLSHPGLARVFESRWLDGGTLAVATARVQGKTLAESLKSGEAFSNPRAASVLQEIWAVIDWARTSGVVHRGVTPDNVYFVPASQHVIVALGPMPIPVEGVNDMNGDARTIGTLAWSMLTGKPFVAEDAGQPLEELAPNLALRVVDATEAMVHGARDDQQEPDVPTYVGIVAAGDVLKQAEVELSAMKEEYEEQHRVALAQCENHRLETERMATEQAELLATERADFEETMSAHQKELSCVREELQKEMAALDRRIGEFESRREAIARVRVEHQEQMEEARRAREQAAAEADNDIARGARETLRREQPDIRSVVGAPRKVVLPKREAPRGARPRWAIPAAAIAVLVLAGAAVGGGFYVHSHGVPHRGAPPAPAAPVARSAAGSVVPGAFTPAPPPRTDTVAAGAVPPVDTAAQRARREDSAREAAAAAAKRRVVDRPATETNDTAPVTAPVHDSARDSVWARTDSITRQDSLRRAGVTGDTTRPDSYRDTSRRPDTSRGHVVRVDTTWLDGGRRDSIRRDSIARARRDSGYVRDTTGVRPDSILRVPPT
jgi:hypothetical protein